MLEPAYGVQTSLPVGVVQVRNPRAFINNGDTIANEVGMECPI